MFWGLTHKNKDLDEKLFELYFENLTKAIMDQ